MTSAAVSAPVLLCLGLNCHTAPVGVRERFSVPKRELANTLRALHALPPVEECVVLSTCNRTEIYCCTAQPEAAAQVLLTHFRVEPALLGHFYRYEQQRALTHLARVAAGLDSAVLGETEIFGQLKDAYEAAHAAGTTARGLNRLFQRVFSIGKKVRHNTRITGGPTSVGAAGVQMAQEFLGSLEGRNILIVGAGEAARTTAQSLCSRGAESIFVANRSYERAEKLAAEVGGKVIRFTDWVPYLENIDIVIVSTASPVYVVSPPVLERVQQVRQRPLCLIDLSVPRNADPACAEVPGVYLYDMDAMVAATEATRKARAAEVGACETMIAEWVAEQGGDLLQLEAPTAVSA